MKAAIGGVFAAAGLFALIFLVGWAVEGNNFFIYKTFAPKYEQVRAKTFEESHAYNEGVAQDLSRAQKEYVQATPEQKRGLRSIILHRYSVYDSERLPPHLQTFLDDLRKDQK